MHLKGRLPQLLLVAMLMVFPSFSFLHSEAKINPEDYDSVAFLHNLFALDYEDYDIANIQLEIDAALNYAHQASGFNGTVLVARNEKLVYSGSVGFAEFKDKELIDEHDAFQLASVSKQFTAAAILQLAEQKAISLDDSITHYIPELSYDQITIRQLLNHTSGLAIYFWLAEHKWEGDHAPSNEEMIALLAQYDMPQFFRSGRRFDYSNTGYILLASVVERVSGQSFGDYVEENIFKPLNMDDSFVYSFDHSPIRNNQLAGFRRYGRTRKFEIPGTVNDGTVGDKNVYATANDLYKWITGLNNGLVISQESLEQMYTRGVSRYGRQVPYGFGFRLGSSGGEQMIYHDGKWNGFRTSLRQYEDGLTIILLEHSSYSYPSSMVNKVKQIVRGNMYAQDPV